MKAEGVDVDIHFPIDAAFSGALSLVPFSNVGVCD